MKDGNFRVFFPVGMGGFSFERMDDTTIVFDCGSISKKVVERNISELRDVFFDVVKQPVIDHLFLSHFDSDHRNGVEKLLNVFEVKEIHLPYIDYKYRPILSFLTDNGPVELYNMLIQSHSNSKISFYQANRMTGYSIKSKNQKWEWVITNLLNTLFFDKVKVMMERYGIEFEEYHAVDPLEELITVGGDVKQEVDIKPELLREMDTPQNTSMIICTPYYRDNFPDVEVTKKILKNSVESFSCLTINDKLRKANNSIADILKDIESNCGYAKNEYGMLMLSKHLSDAETYTLFFKNQTLEPWYRYYHDCELTSCLYTGDMSMDKNQDLGSIMLLQKYNDEPFQFFQIPHHGSSHNSNLRVLNGIETLLYFCYDSNCKRLLQNLGSILPVNNPIHYPLDILLIDRTSEMDEVVEIY